jgi:hypothetical protein
MQLHKKRGASHYNSVSKPDISRAINVLNRI